MRFRHSDAIWNEHPALVAGLLHIRGVSSTPVVTDAVARYTARAQTRLASMVEGDWPEIQAWRRAFARMALKPTQYRCAAEALLRRLRKEGSLPQLHPVVDLCNALSVAWGTPIALFDTARIEGDMEVRPATGGESYLSFSGDTELAESGEIIFADAAGRAHARRWSHRQSAWSAIRAETSAMLVVAEALHASARADVAALVQVLSGEVQSLGCVVSATGVLNISDRQFHF